MPDRRQRLGSDLAELTRLACRLGATGARVIGAGKISVENELARLCREPRCENFGLSPSCPPHVSGPAGFRKLLKRYRHAIALKIELPYDIMLSSELRDYMGLLHEIAAGVEQAAVEIGYAEAHAFAGGSCKELFCRDHAECRVLAEGGPCRNPRKARPSMSGFGINVSKLMQASGWTMNRVSAAADSNRTAAGTIAALVLIG
jgi:predicted metal-binding protein